MKTLSNFAVELTRKQEERDALVSEYRHIENVLKELHPPQKYRELRERRQSLSVQIGVLNTDIKALCVQEQSLSREIPDHHTLARVARGLANILTERSKAGDIVMTDAENAYMDALAICLGESPRPKRRTQRSADTLAILDAMLQNT